MDRLNIRTQLDSNFEKLEIFLNKHDGLPKPRIEIEDIDEDVPTPRDICHCYPCTSSPRIQSMIYDQVSCPHGSQPYGVWSGNGDVPWTPESFESDVEIPDVPLNKYRINEAFMFSRVAGNLPHTAPASYDQQISRNKSYGGRVGLHTAPVKETQRDQELGERMRPTTSQSLVYLLNESEENEELENSKNISVTETGETNERNANTADQLPMSPDYDITHYITAKEGAQITTIRHFKGKYINMKSGDIRHFDICLDGKRDSRDRDIQTA